MLPIFRETLGYGEDCFRTWESVLLGAIPVVRRSLIRSIFRDAPVLVLDDLLSQTAKATTFLGHQVQTTR